MRYHESHRNGSLCRIIYSFLIPKLLIKIIYHSTIYPKVSNPIIATIIFDKNSLEPYVDSIIDPFRLLEGIICYENKARVPGKNVEDLLYLADDNRLRWHFSFVKTFSDWRTFIGKENFVISKKRDECQICQQAKVSGSKPFEVPQPVELPDRGWGSVASDFFARLAKIKNHLDAITTYLDRFTKRVQFLATRSTTTAVEVAHDFYNRIFRLHGLPDSIVSDRDPRFTSGLWTELMRLSKVKLKMSTSHHLDWRGIGDIRQNDWKLFTLFLRLQSNWLVWVAYLHRVRL